MAVRLVAVGYVDDTQRPFHYFCSSAQWNQSNRRCTSFGTGQFSFTFDSAAFTGSLQDIIAPVTTTLPNLS